NGNAWAGALGLGAGVYGLGMVWNLFVLPRPTLDIPAVHATPGENQRNIVRTLAVIAGGVCAYFLIASIMQFIGHGIFSSLAGRESQRIVAKWQLTPHEMQTQFVTLIGTAALLVPMIWLTRNLIAGSPMGEAF